MKKFSKKLLSLVLAAVTVFSLSSVSFAAAPAKVTKVSAYNIDDDEINLKWNSVKNADGYSVYIHDGNKWRGYSSTKRLYMEVDDLQSAKVYKFKVRAYELVKGERNYGAYSSVITAVTEPEEVENLKASSKARTSITLKWSKVPRAKGYQVYLYDKAAGKYVKKAVVSSNSATIKSLKENTSYSFKVRAYYKYDGKYYYGDYSDVLKVKTAAKNTTSSSSTVIAESKAAQIALTHAKLKKADVRGFECELDYENGVKVYEVSFEHGKYEYDYVINAKTGKIIRYEKERD